MSAKLTAHLASEALDFAAANKIAEPGDIVETTWAGWKRPRMVRIVSVGAHLIADWSKERGFFVDFDMTYVGHRIRKDGSSAERVPESGICLSNVKTSDGRTWRDRAIGGSRNARWFNHTALSWVLQRMSSAGRQALRTSDGGKDA